MKWIVTQLMLCFCFGCNTQYTQLPATILKIDMDLPDAKGVMRKIHHEARVIYNGVDTYYQLPKMHTRRSGDSSLVQVRFDDADWFVHHQGNNWVNGPDSKRITLDSFLKQAGFLFNLGPAKGESLLSRRKSGDSVVLTYRNPMPRSDTDPDESRYFFLPQTAERKFSFSPSLDSMVQGRLVRMCMIYYKPAREYRFSVYDTMIRQDMSQVGVSP